MNKRYALITDIHGNIDSLNAILEDIKKQNIDEIYCLGDVIGIGPDSKECVDLLMNNNIKTILGNHELYLLKGTNIDETIQGEEKKHHEWIKASLKDKEIDFIKKCPLYYKIDISYNDKISNKEIILCHYLIKDEKLDYPFEKEHLKNDVNLWIKYNASNIIYVLGHLHKSFDENIVNGISEDYITEIYKLPNIVIVDSLGCSEDEYARYTILEINKGIKFQKVKVKYDRDKFIEKVKNIDFPDKKNVMKYFYGID